MGTLQTVNMCYLDCKEKGVSLFAYGRKNSPKCNSGGCYCSCHTGSKGGQCENRADRDISYNLYQISKFYFAIKNRYLKLILDVPEKNKI